MTTMDFSNVDAAFRYLADDPKGQAALKAFGDAVNSFSKALPKVNGFEAQYIVSALVQQRVGVQGQIQRAAGSKEVHGFVIKAAVTV